MKLRCLLVDDEPLARRVLVKYLQEVPFLELAGECGTALEALAFLHDRGADLMFLDIKMPGLTGLELLRSLPAPPRVILTTAYSEHALEAYEFGVVDYLLKPFSFERFLRAVNRAATAPAVEPEAWVSLKVDKDLHRVAVAEIRYLEGYGNYVKVYLGDRMLLVASTLQSMEQKLSAFGILRIHKSYLINPQHLSRLTPSEAQVGEALLPLGNAFKAEVFRRLG